MFFNLQITLGSRIWLELQYITVTRKQASKLPDLCLHQPLPARENGKTQQQSAYAGLIVNTGCFQDAPLLPEDSSLKCPSENVRCSIVLHISYHSQLPRCISTSGVGSPLYSASRCCDFSPEPGALLAGLKSLR